MPASAPGVGKTVVSPTWGRPGRRLRAKAGGHQLRLAGSAARAAEVPIAAIVKAAGITRQAVCNWSAGYGQGHGLTVATGTHLASLPVQRPRVARGAPVLILGARNITLTGLPGRWDAAEQQV